MNNKELLDLYIEDLKTPVYFDGKVRPKYWKWPLFEKWGQFLVENYVPKDNFVYSNTGAKAWVWSDLHFHHKNIIEYSGRPFKTLEEMHSVLLNNHNSLVDKNDTVIWLGDVGFANDKVLNEMLKDYNGYKILVMGNHDLNHDRFRELEFNEIHIVYKIELPNVSMAFTHYPMANLPKPMVNIHGHEHKHKNKTHYPDSPQHINVCCEFRNFAPVSLDYLIETATNKSQRMKNLCRLYP